MAFQPTTQDGLGKLLRKYRDDVGFFVEDALKVVPKGGGTPIPFRLKPAQVTILEAVKQSMVESRPCRLIVLKARQLGASTIAEAIGYRMCSTRERIRGLVLAHDVDSARGILDKCRVFHQYDRRIGLGIMPLTAGLSKDDIRFDNPDWREATTRHGLGSTLQVGTADNRNIGHSATLQFFHGSETARWPFPEVLTGVLEALANEPGTVGILESTANGAGNAFHETWIEAAKGANEWQPIFLSWKGCPEYRKTVPAHSRARFMDSLTPLEVRLMEHHGLDIEEIAWRRQKLASPECRGQGRPAEDVFREQYPLCVTGETRVSTELGILPIAEAAAARLTESGPIVAWAPQPAAPIWTLVTEKGRILRGTHNHPVKTDHGWRYLGELKVGDVIRLLPPRFAETQYVATWHPIPGASVSVVVDERWALLLGYFMGDGCWFKTELSVACDAKDEDVATEVERLLTELVSRPSRKTIQRVQGRKGCIYLYWKRRICVPECIWRSPKSAVRAFLSALFECDGSASGGRVSFATKSAAFAREVQLLLLGFGLNVSIRQVKKTAGNRKLYDQSVICMTKQQSKLFMEQIGFRGARKGRLKIETGERGRPQLPNDLFDTVRSVTVGAEEQTYNLTVEPEHVFSANGLFTHNSPDEAFVGSGRQYFDQGAVAVLESKAEKLPYTDGDVVFEDGREPEIRTQRAATAFRPNRAGRVRIWARPQPAQDYVVGADVAAGLRGGDYSNAYVMQREPPAIVARLRGIMDPEEYARALLALGWYYGKAFLAPEANSIGLVVARYVARRYTRTCHHVRLNEGEYSDPDPDRPGWWTDRWNRIEILGRLRQAVSSRELEIPDEQLLAEMRTFIVPVGADGRLKEGQPRASRSNKDDCIMSAAIAFWVNDIRIAGPVLKPKTIKAVPPTMLHAVMQSDVADESRKPGAPGRYDEHLGALWS